jgi:hypothetical protein
MIKTEKPKTENRKPKTENREPITECVIILKFKAKCERLYAKDVRKYESAKVRKLDLGIRKQELGNRGRFPIP